MKIPKDHGERLQFYGELTEKIFASAEDRRNFYDVMRAYVRDGGPQTADYPIFNNMGAHLDLVSSMIYAQDTTRFSINPDATESAEVFDQLPIASQRVQQEWRDSNADLVFGDAVFASLATATSIVKLIWNNGGVQPYEVMPENFGVLREDIPMLDRQQAMGERYRITQAALKTALMNHPRSAEIMFRITWSQKPEERPDTNDGQRQLWMSSFNDAGTMVGNVGMPGYGGSDPVAKIIEPMADMIDLWIWDDAAGDYWVVTMAEPDVVIYERHADDGREETLFLKAEHPYIQICPDTDPKYFWGRAEAGKLRPLQDWLTERLWGIRRMMKRQANPPKVGSGLYGDESEVAEALTTPGNYVAGDTIGKFDIKELKPDIPDDLFKDVNFIMEMFNIISGLPKSLQGQGEAGVRSEGHANTVIRTASSRVKKKALKVEHSLNRAATLMFKMLKKRSNDHLIDTKGKQFTIAQIGSDVEVEVDAHSSSPAFIEDMKAWAGEMLKSGLIDSDEYFNLTNPPMREILKAKARQMQANRARAEQQEKQEDRVIELARHRA